MGRRLADLITLRDLARRVLHSQNEGWPEGHRQEARRVLNRAYDRFTQAYGPINTTTFGERQDGAVIRRMPNLVTFRDDPDAMLVMSLEDRESPARCQGCDHGARRGGPQSRDVRAERRRDCCLPQHPWPRRSARYPASIMAMNQIIAELGDLLYQTRAPASGRPPMSTCPGMSGRSWRRRAGRTVCPQCRGVDSRAAGRRLAR
jgi:hypothetical protein